MNKNQNNESDLIKIKQQQAAQIVVGLLLCVIFVFISGYYFGKKRALETFTDQFENDSFADKMAYSICSIYDTGDKNSGESSENGDNSEGEEDSQNGETDEASEVPITPAATAATPEMPKVSVKYFAQLAGFGTESAALKCADQIRRKGLPVVVKEKISKSSRGRSIKWYQVVTQNYDDKQQLVNRIDKVSKSVKLKDVKIKEQKEQQEG